MCQSSTALTGCSCCTLCTNASLSVSLCVSTASTSSAIPDSCPASSLTLPVCVWRSCPWYAASAEPATLASSCSRLHPIISSVCCLSASLDATFMSASPAIPICRLSCAMSFLSGPLRLADSARVHLAPNLARISASLRSSSSTTASAASIIASASARMSPDVLTRVSSPATPPSRCTAGTLSRSRLGSRGSEQSTASSWGVILIILALHDSVSACSRATMSLTVSCRVAAYARAALCTTAGTRWAKRSVPTAVVGSGSASDLAIIFPSGSPTDVGTAAKKILLFSELAFSCRRVTSLRVSDSPCTPSLLISLLILRPSSSLALALARWQICLPLSISTPPPSSIAAAIRLWLAALNASISTASSLLHFWLEACLLRGESASARGAWAAP
mmetsp:Transcript_27584/g.69630  ORF Transcript_27584/g.69630 Transcript_27584/m.69630 type:complete len:390 (+) Transcript_27584:394-1563(+)